MEDFGKCAIAFGIGSAVGAFGMAIYHKIKEVKAAMAIAATQPAPTVDQNGFLIAGKVEVNSPAPAHEPKDAEIVFETPIVQVEEQPNIILAEKPSIKEFAKSVRLDEEAPKKIPKVHSITADEFGPYEDDRDGYAKAVWRLYSDGVLEDEQYNKVDNPSVYLGKDWDKPFTEEDKDVCYIRNEIYKIDYEIDMDARPYSAVYPNYASPMDYGEDDDE